MNVRPLENDREAESSTGADAWMRDSGLTMADFPAFGYSKKQVVRAGDALRGELLWSDDCKEKTQEIFRIAYAWRDSHVYPMYRMRHEMLGIMRAGRLRGLTVARLKRMPSIRKKLTRIPAKLNQIQDLGGCRAILPSIADVNSLRTSYLHSSRHRLREENNYIELPKLGGYRSYHIIMNFTGNGADEVYNGRRIEIQLRSRLQHSWATAVEAAGLLRREDLKAGEGNLDWLRLFDLMSGELALAEKCPEPAHLPSHKERVEEIKELDARLNALSTLENFRHAVKAATRYVRNQDTPRCFRIEYNHAAKTVTVSPHSKPMSGVEDYEAAELQDSMKGDGNINTVFVDADKIEDLRQAYPNYFGDVKIFCQNLKLITQGKAAKEYTMPPQEAVPPPPREAPDLSWFRRVGRWS